MVIREIQHILETWAPRELRWEGDNIGLQVGSPGKRVKKILISLDVSEQVIAEAQRKAVNLIISHHPLLFTPIKSLTTENRTGSLLLALAKSDIALISAHTNLDFTHDGVSFALAKRIGLTDIEVLVPQTNILSKIVVFVPHKNVDEVMTAMANAGAGFIGKYDNCSYRTEGTGTFRGGKGTKPAVGKAGKLEHVKEVRLEMIVQSWNLRGVIKAMNASHPYEEVAYDVYRLENELKSVGAGAIGNLPAPLTLKKFLYRIHEQLQIPALRYTGSPRTSIRKVAVCGGSGSQLVHDAISSGADAYVTADVKYHTFQDAEEKIVLVDAGHYETEVPIIQPLVAYMKKQLQARRESLPVFASRFMSNPVHYNIM